MVRHTRTGKFRVRVKVRFLKKLLAKNDEVHAAFVLQVDCVPIYTKREILKLVDQNLPTRIFIKN